MEKKDIHKLVLKYILTLFVVVFLVVAAGAISRWGSSLAPAREITVSGQGKTTATPDLAEVSFSVISQGASPDALDTDNNKKMSAVIGFVKSLGIASSDIATVNYDLSPDYASTVVNMPMIPVVGGAPSPNTIVGYTLTQTVEVKVRDFTNIAKLLGGLTPLGINQVSGVTFTFSNPDSVLAIARADAIVQAEAKAGEMAVEAGTSLGGVVSIQEYGNVPVYPMSYAAAAPMATGIANVSTPTIEPGTQDITDQVTIIYELK